MLTLLQKFVAFIDSVAHFLGLNASQTSALETFVATNVLTVIGFITDAVTRLIQGQPVDFVAFGVIFTASIVPALMKGVFSYSKQLAALMANYSTSQSTNIEVPQTPTTPTI